MSDPIALLNVTAKEKLACAARELAMRRNVYPKWVQSKKMTQRRADQEILCMEAIVQDYRIIVGQKDAGELPF